MRLDLEKIFVLDLKYKKHGISPDKLDQSLERFFNIFDRNPGELVRLMEKAVKDELKERALLALSATNLTQEDEENFKPVTLDDLNQAIKDN
jgi:hypothetical protein